jgi:hypothetical protein
LSRGLPLEAIETLFDQVAFIDFNYDRCLEYFLVHAIRRAYGLYEDHAQKICGRLRVIHPYGSVGKLPTMSTNGVPFGLASQNHLAPARGIKTYTEQISDTAELSAIREEIATAQNIIFLGFAYHDQNMQMLLPPQPQPTTLIFGTAYKMSQADMSVVARQLTSMFGIRL